MNKRIIETTEAPAAIGPYSQAVLTDTLGFISGQLPLQPGSSEIVEGTIEAHTRQALDNIRSIVESAEKDLSCVVKTTIFLTDLNDFKRVNSVYGEYFPIDPPARATVGVAALPLGSPIEIEAIFSL